MQRQNSADGLTAKHYASDEFITPYGPVFGVTLQAHMVDHLISLALGERRQIWVWPKWVEWLWIAVWAISGAGMGTAGRNHRKWLATSFIGGPLILYVICRFTMGLAAGWIPMLPPMAAFILSHVIVVYTDLKFRSLDSKQTTSNP
ncbi:MAG: CHASE2 domain-containing protein [Leptolyngbyaceae cyanobacterium SM2_5_2]|nr:CHASE2 domain-containing protein [Leptolyngbyaceae cyanobacterium SM2_5_2]